MSAQWYTPGEERSRPGENQSMLRVEEVILSRSTQLGPYLISCRGRSKQGCDSHQQQHVDSHIRRGLCTCGLKGKVRARCFGGRNVRVCLITLRQLNGGLIGGPQQRGYFSSSLLLVSLFVFRAPLVTWLMKSWREQTSRASFASFG